MKNTLLAGTALIVVLNAGVAQSADLASAPYVKAQPIVAPTWSGFYIGANVGAVSTGGDLTAVAQGITGGPHEHRFNDTFDEKTGFLAGGQIGYNWQTGQAVYGLEADVSWMDQTSQSETFNDPFFHGKGHARFSSSLDWLATVRARAGIAATPALLLYVTGGLAVAGVKVKYENDNGFGVGPFTNSVSSSSTKLGWTAGLGAEYALGGNWSVKAEYLHVALDPTTLDVVNIDQNLQGPVKFSHDIDLIRAGLNLRF